MITTTLIHLTAPCSQNWSNSETFEVAPHRQSLQVAIIS